MLQLWWVYLTWHWTCNVREDCSYFKLISATVGTPVAAKATPLSHSMPKLPPPSLSPEPNSLLCFQEVWSHVMLSNQAIVRNVCKGNTWHRPVNVAFLIKYNITGWILGESQPSWPPRCIHRARLSATPVLCLHFRSHLSHALQSRCPSGPTKLRPPPNYAQPVRNNNICPIIWGRERPFLTVNIEWVLLVFSLNISGTEPLCGCWTILPATLPAEHCPQILPTSTFCQ